MRKKLIQNKSFDTIVYSNDIHPRFFEDDFYSKLYYRGAGTGGAGGAIAPPIFGSSIRMHSNSTTNIFG